MVNVSVPSRYDARRPTVSATMPVGTSNSTMPAVKKALAANASTFERPASSRKIVLMPQMNDAASVFPRTSTRYVRWMDRGLGMLFLLVDFSARFGGLDKTSQLKPRFGQRSAQ